MLKDIASMTIMRIPMIMCLVILVMCVIPYEMLDNSVPTSMQVAQMVGAAFLSVLLHFVIKVPNHGGTDQ